MWHYHSESRRSEQLQGKSLFGSPVGHFEVDFSDFEMLCFIYLYSLVILSSSSKNHTDRTKIVQHFNIVFTHRIHVFVSFTHDFALWSWKDLKKAFHLMSNTPILVRKASYLCRQYIHIFNNNSK